MTIRPMSSKDVESVYSFWQENYKVSERESIERLKAFLEKNKELSSVAEDSGEIIGTTLGSYDGRKGYIYKVVVRDDFKGTGLGKKLVQNTVEAILKAGGLDIRVGCSKDLIGFYKKCGFKLKEGLYNMQIKKY